MRYLYNFVYIIILDYLLRDFFVEEFDYGRIKACQGAKLMIKPN